MLATESIRATGGVHALATSARATLLARAAQVLGGHSEDLDVVVDDMTGVAFAMKVAKYANTTVPPSGDAGLHSRRKKLFE